MSKFEKFYQAIDKAADAKLPVRVTETKTDNITVEEDTELNIKKDKLSWREVREIEEQEKRIRSAKLAKARKQAMASIPGWVRVSK